MTQSSKQSVNPRAVVIATGNELAAVTALLDELAVPTEIWTERALPMPNDLEGAGLVVVLGRRLIDSGAPVLSLWPRTIAVVDDMSRTLAAHLNRLGVKLIVRRPIHARTLRLVLLHEIYRGPERRRKKRILIGHPIRVGGGLFKQKGTLLELSPGGARVELPSAPKIGTEIKLMLGKELTHGKPLRLQARVVRCIRPSGEKGRVEAEIGVQLVNPRASEPVVRAILERFSRGPASWQGNAGATAAGRVAENAPASAPAGAPPASAETATTSAEPPTATSSADASATRPAPADDPGPIEEIDPESSARRLPPMRRMESVPTPAQASEAAAPEPCEATDDTGDGAERRQDPRIPYERRVVALGEEAARVLVGRDLSAGGMRIDATDAVEIGDVLKVALHCGDEMEPVVVVARADRYDGDAGIVLRFRDLDDDRRQRLEKIIASASPLRSVPADVDPNEVSGSFVLGEIRETIERAPRIETDEQVDAHLDAVFEAGGSV